MDKVNVALIGTGGMVNGVYYLSLASFDDVNLVGLCDLIKKGIMFPFTHQILKWCYESRTARSVRILLARQLGTRLFQDALLIEQYALSVEVQGRDGRYPYLLTGKNSEYPFLIQSRNQIEIPADTFFSDEV